MIALDVAYAVKIPFRVLLIVSFFVIGKWKVQKECLDS